LVFSFCELIDEYTAKEQLQIVASFEEARTTAARLLRGATEKISRRAASRL